ncbi:glycosyltransferase family 39 protein [Patescibacteria group bacterium]|nr:glycosyltransferase family 39 protein [Patescibacteria group bacterium]
MSNKINFAIYIFLSLFLSFSFSVNGLWYFIFSAFIGFVVLLYKPQVDGGFSISKYFLIIPLSIFLISRLLPFILYGPHPLGYDTGFYKYNINQERSHNLGGLFSSVDESTGSRIITETLVNIGFSDQAIMYGFYIFVGALIGLFIYLLAKIYFGETAAIFSVFAYSISFVQYLAFWNMFWKNAVGLCLSLLIFLLIEKNKLVYFLAVLPLIVAVIITHKTSAFLLILSLALYAVLNKKIKNSYKILSIAALSALGMTFLFINKDITLYIWQQVNSGFKTYYDFFSVKEGIFIDTYQFFNIGFSFFYIPFALLTILSLFKNRKINQVLIYLSICVFIILAKFIFYKRVLIFLDISLLIFFGYSFSIFVEKIKIATSERYIKVFLFILLFSPTFLFFINVTNQKPLISKEEIKSIEDFRTITPILRLFTYNSYYTPWLYGFSGHKIIAPGWGDDKWDFKKWQIFWGSNMENKKEMLADFRPPILIYDNGDGFFQFNEGSCFTKIKNNLYVFSCQ